MNENDIRRAIEDDELYEESTEDSLRSMLADFYSKRMRATAILVWINFLVYLALVVVSAVLFFRTDQTKYEIMYAALFICSVVWASLTKVFGWQAVNRNNIKREIKRLEIRLMDLERSLRKPGA